MKTLFLIVILFNSLEGVGQRKIGLLCTNFKINNEIRDDGSNYRKSLESVLSNLKNPPLIIDRDNLPELLIKIQEEANLNRDFKMSKPVLKAANVDYIMYANLEKQVVNENYDLQLELIKISGEETFSKKTFPIIVFSERELVNKDQFRNKLNGLLSTYAFTEDFGIIENQQLEKIQKRLDEKDIEINNLKSGLKDVKDEAKQKNTTINSLSEVVVQMQKDNFQKESIIKGLKKDVTEIKNFASIAELNLFGLKQYFGFGFTGWQTELYLLMSQVITNKDNSAKISLADSSLLILNTVITKYPKFPFSYWAKSIILLKNKNDDWLQNALKAIEILQITITIEGHKPEHDQIYQMLTEFVSNSKTAFNLNIDAFF